MTGIMRHRFAVTNWLTAAYRTVQLIGRQAVHLGGTLAEIAHAEAQVARGEIPERPFVLLAQPTMFDPTRAPAGKHGGVTFV